ncbi:MAG: hypothetical protein BWY95_01785 [Bacteroidetes bacterium ADurb.BinA104]|nr:MAG: hypothetical protein BWY95_01785 [Bacteroidetes bacterium ADurb.BinA104]
MNEELTNEVLEAMKKCKQDCPSCGAIGVCSKYGWQEMMQALATALLEERAKPKVWDGAPYWVNAARVRFFVNDRNDGHSEVFSETYRRELPKTRARQIAENIVHGINGETHGETKDIEYVEGVLKRYAEELKGEA